MSVQSNAGTKWFIGPPNSTAATQNDFEALVYSEVGEVEEVPQFGDVATVIRASVLNDARVKKAVGTKDGQEMTIPYLFDPADTGQADLRDAGVSDTEYAFKVELDDAGSGSPSNPTTFYWRGKLYGEPVVIGTADNFVRMQAMVTNTTTALYVAAV
jgi:hypothetical protein